MQKTGIVIPCYNEEQGLDLEAFEEYAKKRDDLVLCFVDDGSTDGTYEMLSGLRSKDPDNIFVE